MKTMEEALVQRTRDGIRKAHRIWHQGHVDEQGFLELTEDYLIEMFNEAYQMGRED